MKVLILTSSEKTKKAEEIKVLCHKMGVDSLIYGRNNNSKTGLSSHLDKNDLIIVIWDKNSIHNPAVIFSTGYCIGINRLFIIFGNGKADIPHCNGKAVLISNKEELKIYITAEIIKIKNEKNIEDAKANILEMGFELIIRDLVDVVSEGEILVFEQFLKAGFLPDSLDKNGVSLLNIAIRKGHAKIATILLEQGADVNSISGDRGNTPLMDAAAEVNIEIMKKLIKAGADLDLKSKSGQTALVLSVGRQAEESAVLLIKSGADISIKDDLGMSARKYAELFKLNTILLLMDEKDK
ncbi:MAG: ankyrin repeat domain-containing protein [Spirochaetota bacterium]|nr:ankyrin repeat domain-containing protein [Spirochaetota bacterium]